MTRVKVCCIGSVAEAALAVRMGASAVGLVSEMPSGPGVIADGVDAIRSVGPFGVDLCSGVRTGGSLDPAKLERFMAGVAGAVVDMSSDP